MFDIGFWELAIIMVVALLVIGPERLPGVARKLGLYLGKARRFISSVKADINKELAADELKRVLKEQQDSVGLHDIIEDTKEALNEAKQEYLVKNKEDIEQTARSIEESAQKPDTDDGTRKN
jgi:sec-independent protein translocase protein TatB